MVIFVVMFGSEGAFVFSWIIVVLGRVCDRSAPRISPERVLISPP
jgi:hypothetical protein